MDKDSAPSSRERAQILYDKNIELENNRRKSAQARVPSDPNAWQQMRENYEAIILEDHGFSEQHNVEYALWQLHYRRIEELRSHFQSALNSANSNSSQGSKVTVRPDRITKLRLQFKTFLSEATGFYHDLILKIRAKYGLPLGYFSEGSDCLVAKEKDGKKMNDVKKGLVSCHRCLIYLGDLARYKGLYGEGDSKSREYPAATSYYLQAASLWPSSGNPHHQLAILASYTGDELVAVYRYFRSLAVENPFVTARDNLIVAFEKNRQIFSQLPGDPKSSVLNDSTTRMNGKARGKGDMKNARRSSNVEERVSNIQDSIKSFCIRFVRLNGILFTRTSIETFEEVLLLTRNAFCELLSRGPEEKLNFGSDATENSVFFIRLASILIFSVHNVKKDTEGQTYAEIVQRAVLLQNAFTAAFELMGCILESVLQLSDPSSSYLLPCILVFLEWLACYPDISSSDLDDSLSGSKVSFWNNCVPFLNKVLSFSNMSTVENDDDTCFYNMKPYEGESGNCYALGEDFELRGFTPILPAQTILDFSRKQAFGSDGINEKAARIKRLVAAGKALVTAVKVDQKSMWFDSKAKKFMIGVEEPNNESRYELENVKDIDDSGGTLGIQSCPQLFAEMDDEDEVIVFKPLVPEISAVTRGSALVPRDYSKVYQNSSAGDLQMLPSATSTFENVQMQSVYASIPHLASVSSGDDIRQQLQPISSNVSKRISEEVAGLANSMQTVSMNESVSFIEQDAIAPQIWPAHVERPIANPMNLFYGQSKVPESLLSSNSDAPAPSRLLLDNVSGTTGLPMQSDSRNNKTPGGRPVRHIGPPPGFSHVTSKNANDHISSRRSELLPTDDYRWLDDYQVPLPAKSDNTGLDSTRDVIGNNGYPGALRFPFPGKLGSHAQLQPDNRNNWHAFNAIENSNSNSNTQDQQPQHQLSNGNQQLVSSPEQYRGQSIWSGRFMV